MLMTMTLTPEANLLPYLQPEVMEKVFTHLDGKSLAGIERVCKEWQELVHGLTQRTDIWKKCCEEEITRDVLIDLLTSFPLQNTLNPKNNEWRLIYKNWCQWKHVKKWAFIKKTFDKEAYKGVSCLKISWPYIITGHDFGSVVLWKNSLHTEITLHKREVTDIGLMTCSENCKKNLNMKHCFVLSTSVDHTVQINPLKTEEKRDGYPIIIKEHYAPTVMIRICRNIFAVISLDEKITVWQLRGNCNDSLPQPVICHKLRMQSDPFIGIGIWGTTTVQVSAMTDSGVCIPIYSENCGQKYKFLQEDTQNFSPLDVWEELHGKILRVFLWRYEVSFVLTDEHYMYVRIEGLKQKKYNTMPYLRSHPVTVLLYGEILLLGMQSGDVYMYLIKNIEDLLYLNLKEDIHWMHSVSSEPIIALDIAETFDGPVIVATTKSDGVSIHFIPPDFR